jgi:hypothetical protein
MRDNPDDIARLIKKFHEEMKKLHGDVERAHEKADFFLIAMLRRLEYNQVSDAWIEEREAHNNWERPYIPVDE